MPPPLLIPNQRKLPLIYPRSDLPSDPDPTSDDGSGPGPSHQDVDSIMELLGISARLHLSSELVEYQSRFVTMVVLTKGPCQIWWAWENDEHGGPPSIWMTNIAELLAYWNRVEAAMIRSDGGIRIWVPHHSPPPGGLDPEVFIP